MSVASLLLRDRLLASRSRPRGETRWPVAGCGWRRQREAWRRRPVWFVGGWGYGRRPILAADSSL